MDNIKDYTISIIVAMSKNNVIGINNDLPWKMKSDLKYFRQITMNKPVIMGRNTYNSLPMSKNNNGRLPGRPIIIVSNTLEEIPHDGGIIHIARNIEDAIDISHTLVDDTKEIMIIGGGQIFNQSIDIVDKIYLTLIDTNTNGDVFFPLIDDDVFDMIDNRKYDKTENDDYDYNLIVYKRK